MRDIPEQIHLLGGTFKIVTDPRSVALALDPEDCGCILSRQNEIVLRTEGVALRVLWECLIHEIIHHAEEEGKFEIDHDCVYRIAAVLTDFMERNGMLRRDSD